MEVFDHTEWSSTCPLLVAVLTDPGHIALVIFLVVLG